MLIVLSSCHREETHDEKLAKLLPSKTLDILQLPSVQAIEKKLGGLTDVGISNLSKFPSLVFLDISRAEITNKGFGIVGTLTNLRELYLSDCHGITDDGIGTLQYLTHLENLSMDGCERVTGASFGAIASLRKIKSLNLGSISNINPQAILHLKELPVLEELSLAHCSSINDRCVELLGSFPALRDLDLGHCWSVSAASLIHLKGLSSTLRKLVLPRTYKKSKVEWDKAVQSLRVSLPNCSISTL